MLLENFHGNLMKDDFFNIVPFRRTRSSMFEDFDRLINTNFKRPSFFKDSFFGRDSLFNQDLFFEKPCRDLDFFENDGFFDSSDLFPLKLRKNSRRNAIFGENNLLKNLDLEDMKNFSNNENCQKKSTGFSLSKRSVTKDGQNITTIDRKLLKDGKVIGDNIKKITNEKGETEVIRNGDIENLSLIHI